MTQPTIIFLCVAITFLQTIKSSSNLYVEPKGNIVLKCKLSNDVLTRNHNSAKSALYQWRFLSTDAAKQGGRPQSLVNSGPSGEWKAFAGLDVIGDRSKGEFNLQISQADYDRHDGEYNCEINLPKGEVYQSDPFRLYVLYQPSVPTISYISNNFESTNVPNVLTENDSLSLICSTMGGNPPPEVVWYHGDEPLKSQIYAVADSKDAGTTSRLVFDKLTKHHHMQDYRCEVKNVAIDKVLRITSKQLNVKYKPRVSVNGFVLQHQDFIGPFNPIMVEKGTSLKIACTVDANPPINSPWWRNKGTVLPNKTGYNLTFSSNDINYGKNGAFECVAQNEIGESSAEIGVDVFYAPQVEIEESEKVVNEGDGVVFKCNAKALPEVKQTEVKWFKAGQHIGSGHVLELSDVHRSQKGEYICSAKNVFNVSAGTGEIERISKAKAQLIVQYRPGPTKITVVETTMDNSSPVQVFAGSSISLKCESDDPGMPQASYRWNKRGDIRFTHTGSYLNFTSLTLSHNGRYECSPSNLVGEGLPSVIRLDVNEPVSWASPQSLRKQVVQSINDDELVLRCSARGRPAPKIRWYKNGKYIHPDNKLFRVVTNDPTTIDSYSFLVQSELRFEGDGRKDLFNGDKRVMRSDRGIYGCVADGARDSLTHNTTVVVQYIPEFRNQFTKAPATLDPKSRSNSATLTCLVESMPSPTISWSRNGELLTSSSRIRITSLTTLDEENFKSTLVINNPTSADLGSYICTARNLIGEKSLTLTLTERSIPDNPTQLESKDIFYNSALLTWNSGFDGGYKQTFTVHMQSSDSSKGELLFTPNPPSASWILVPNLEPEARYSFFVTSLNQLGSSQGRSNVKTIHMPVPPQTFDELPTPTDVELVLDTGEIIFETLAPEENAAELCANIEVLRTNLDWKPLEKCFKFTDTRSVFRIIEFEQLYKDESKEFLSGFSNARVRLCQLRNSNACSKPVYWNMQVLGSSTSSSMSSQAVIAIVIVVVAVISLTLIIGIIMCRRQALARFKHVRKSENSDPSKKLSSPDISSPSHFVQTASGTNKVTNVDDFRNDLPNGTHRYNVSQHDEAMYASHLQPQYLENGYASQELYSPYHQQNANPQQNGLPPTYYTTGQNFGEYHEWQDPHLNTYAAIPHQPHYYDQMNGLPDPYEDESSAQFLSPITTTNLTRSTQLPDKTPSYGDGSDESGYSTSNSRGKRVIREIIV